MLNILIENFNKNFLPEGNLDQQEMDHYLDREWTRINDASYLEEMVVGKARFAWDYRALEGGFEKLISPFAEDRSFIPVLFLNCLRDLGCSKQEYKQALIFSEYSYYIAVINDYFNLQKEFTKNKVDLREAARLTQIKYAGQYLSTYPNYLLINNVMGLDAGRINRIHQLLSNISAAVGMSRGVLMKWNNRLFTDVTEQMYCQNAINSLCHFIIFPVVLAAILASVTDKDIELLKKAFSHLTLFAKLRLERAMLQADPAVSVSSSSLNSFQVMTLPGFLFINNKLSLDEKVIEGEKFPYFSDVYHQVLKQVRTEVSDKQLAATKALEEESFQAFITIMKQTGLLKNSVEKIQKSFNV